MTWLLRHSEDFRVAPRTDDELLWQVKHLVELVTMLITLSNHGIRNSTTEELTEIALKYGAAFDWHELAAYDASAATVVAVIADFFIARGLPPPMEMEFVRGLHTMGFFEGMDRVPFREMDLAYSLGLMIDPQCRKDLPVWFASTSFGQRQPLTRYTIDDLYSVTHAAFYLTDFGRNPLADLLDAETVTRFRAELVGLTAVLLRGDNIDVLGELLLCWLFCAVEDSPLHRIIFHQAFERVLLAATPDGQVVPALKHLPRAQAGETTFENVYHTTLVCSMLCAVAAEDMPYVQ